MKILHIACLASVVWLAGCAATGPGSEGTPSSAATTPPQTTVPRHQAIIPGGALQPITAGRASSRDVASMSAPADLWERIRRGFAMPDLQQDLVQDREQWYATRPDYIQRMTERSSKYLFHIVEELERRGMPTELALLPYIESAFNPQAVSSAKAAGMWQFMPATGNYFDLKQNAFRDDRRDVLASTRAALDYLQKLYGMFGDWHLALAAYNWGEGSVGRAIARNQKLGLGTKYTDLNMPAETRLYVPKLQAVKNIVANPDLFKTELPLIENHPYFQAVDISHDIDVALVAQLAGIREDNFKALNPSFSR
ncbi:MAG: transglycosylase SLT domain-containing protein, partial [Burkholderiaceae bacterium]|nr:transglycosylase SLT domain-containing protein [Burkholderiaceae bacterium]